MEEEPETMTTIQCPNAVISPELTCIDTIAPKDNWEVMIGNKKFNLDYLKKNVVWNRMTKFDVTSRVYVVDKNCVLRNVDSLFFYQYVNLRPLYYFHIMQEQCIENCKFLYGFAEKLSGPSVETICRHVFKKKGIVEEFVDLFYTVFFPAYLRRNYNWFSLSLLVRARVAYPTQFTLLVQYLLKDISLSNTILLDFAATLDKEKQTELMKDIVRCNMTHLEFCHNLKLLYFLFTNCECDEQIFNFILVHMEFNANYCTLNKDYGKLLLALIKVHSDFGGRHIIARELVEKHGSAYKSACISILDNTVIEMLRLQHQLLVHRPRFFIPREPAPSLL